MNGDKHEFNKSRKQIKFEKGDVSYESSEEVLKAKSDIFLEVDLEKNNEFLPYLEQERSWNRNKKNYKETTDNSMFNFITIIICFKIICNIKNRSHFM